MTYQAKVCARRGGRAKDARVQGEDSLRGASWKRRSCQDQGLRSFFRKQIPTWISGEHEAGDDEEQEQLDRVNEEDTGDQRGEGEEDGEGRRSGIAEESKQEAGK